LRIEDFQGLKVDTKWSFPVWLMFITGLPPLFRIKNVENCNDRRVQIPCFALNPEKPFRYSQNLTGQREYSTFPALPGFAVGQLGTHAPT
jgi:hypothetical protein